MTPAETRPLRSDLTFLRRRVPKSKPAPLKAASSARPAAAAPPAPAPSAPAPPAPARPGASSPGSPGLVLGHASSAPARPRRVLGPQPFEAPGIGDTRELDERTPILRVDRVRSAVGTLILTGASSIAWESTTFLTGAATASGERFGSVADTDGNRPLLEYDDGAVLVTLRHVRELRRALVIGRDTDALGLRLFDGETLSVPTGAPAGLTILQLLVVDGLLELRAEPVDPALSDADIHQEFGFSMTHRFALPDGPG